MKSAHDAVSSPLLQAGLLQQVAAIEETAGADVHRECGQRALAAVAGGQGEGHDLSAALARLERGGRQVVQTGGVGQLADDLAVHAHQIRQVRPRRQGGDHGRGEVGVSQDRQAHAHAGVRAFESRHGQGSRPVEIRECGHLQHP